MFAGTAVMPIDRQSAFQLGLLLLAVPVQYYVSSYYKSDEYQRSQALKNIYTSAVVFKDKYLSLESWRSWCLEILSKSSLKTSSSYAADDGTDPEGESPAVEVLRYRDPKGYFSGSTEPRSPRPSNVQFRVGQVVKHKRWKYRGVIIGWDPVARAPPDWIKAMHPPDKAHWSRQPNYSILVDTRDRMVPQVTYVPQENIEVLSNTQVIHPQLDDFFEEFDGAQYLPRPSLRTVYPHD